MVMHFSKQRILTCQGGCLRVAARECAQVNSEALRKACPIPFHEGRLWKSADAADLKRQLQTHFRNITTIMDCVGCEKCKLWGKLQLLGAGTLNVSHADAAVGSIFVCAAINVHREIHEAAQGTCIDDCCHCRAHRGGFMGRP